MWHDQISVALSNLENGDCEYLSHDDKLRYLFLLFMSHLAKPAHCYSRISIMTAFSEWIFSIFKVANPSISEHDVKMYVQRYLESMLPTPLTPNYSKNMYKNLDAMKWDISCFNNMTNVGSYCLSSFIPPKPLEKIKCDCCAPTDYSITPPSYKKKVDPNDSTIPDTPIPDPNKPTIIDPNNTTSIMPDLPIVVLDYGLYKMANI